MKQILVLCLTGFSGVLGSCQTAPTISVDAVCTLRIIAVSEATRAYLRAPLAQPDSLPAGYEIFLRELAAHNAKMRTHCDL